MSKIPQEAIEAGARAIWERIEDEISFEKACKEKHPQIEWTIKDAEVCIEAADAARAQGAEVIDLQEYVAQLHQPYVIEEYCVRPHCNGGKPFWAAPVDGWNGNFSKEMALACVASLRASYPSREFRVTPLRSEPDTTPPAPQPTDREKVLEDALRVLEKSATRVSEYGAVTGPQWSHLTGALLKTRAALAGGEAPSQTELDNQPRYTTKRLRDEVAKAKNYARIEAFEDAARQAEKVPCEPGESIAAAIRRLKAPSQTDRAEGGE